MSLREEISKANEAAVERMMEASAIWIDVVEARKVLNVFGQPTLLHAGPPVSWEKASGPLRGALIGATLLEGWADSPEGAERKLQTGEVRLVPTHEVGVVAPMAGAVSPSMPLLVISDPKYGNRAYSNLNEGIGKVLRYGAYDESVLKRLKWMGSEFAESLKAAVDQAVKEKGGLDVKFILTQALNMGDEGHNRHAAGTSLFLNELARYLVMSDLAKDVLLRVLDFVKGNTFTFLNFAMGAAKVMTLAAHNVKYSTVVTVMSRNGTEAGIWISGLGNNWFTAPAKVPQGVLFPGFKPEDANPDIGDSAITETAGFGGFAMAAAPSIVSWVGGNVQFAVENTERMYQITHTKHRYFKIPYLSFQGTPTGIDLRKVVKTGIEPTINTGIAHRQAGVGQIGAGVVSMDMGMFKRALRRYAEEYGIS
ncbi:hypothetical protein HS1genome_2116 [Sulfodiicoccus acidiphilus]|uniref:DUF1116 domain-containing protein n=1 Tax=Sulfodiicoccus acidiphilus TaxID=1670455 RepID=A0A348B6C5_9CREN|nr:DUF1116 domain-containing protein [Sulfodiicoccus acidiphilus]BBD73727.1 hypothetical protein HS1genome_2116 [Sulfodiicoccus acidiphilus]GGT97908.1 hypothetical protein GCM10007116_14330 [Sulfodiicoccus acidiphilus]